jgi:hypothetical protein
MKRKKISISTFLVSALGLVIMCKALIYGLEHYVLQVTGEDGLRVDDSFLNIALAGIVTLLLIRFIYVIVKHKIVKTNKTHQFDSLINEDIKPLVCADCGKKVSEKVREYCLTRPNKFAGKVYCYDHQ